MLIETGRVVAVDGDANALWVETIRQSVCGSCAANKGCGHGLLNRVSEGRSGYIRVISSSDVSARDCAVDDQVRISVPERLILQGSALLYAVPLLTMLALAAVADALWPGLGQGVTIAGAALGLALGFLVVRFHAWRHRDDQNLQPTLVEVLPRLELPTRAADCG
ncbi:MAG: SoxR reducing system RseC family protein [Pseudomonadota bacterium]